MKSAVEVPKEMAHQVKEQAQRQVKEEMEKRKGSQAGPAQGGEDVGAGAGMYMDLKEGDRVLYHPVGAAQTTSTGTIVRILTQDAVPSIPCPCTYS